MKIFITGLGGFLASHLADALMKEGHEIAGNDSFVCGNPNNVPSGTVFYQVDCCDFNGMKKAFEEWKPDVVVHAAATAHEGLSSFSPSFVTRNIYEASVATFSAAISVGVKRIVYMSSMSRYGKGNPPFKETDRPAPVDPYGVAKVASEDTLKILCETHGVRWSILVPHNIIGPRQRSIDPYRNVCAIMINRCKLRKGPIIYGDGMQKRCFSPVKDCIQSIVKAVYGQADKEIVNIGPDGGQISIKALSDMVIKYTGYNGLPIYMPDRPNEVKEAYCSSDKARTLLGYKPEQSIQDCIKEMVEYIQPEEFAYTFPLEIVTDRIPKTWLNKLM